MNLFGVDTACHPLEGKTAAEKLNHYIAVNAPKKAVDLLRKSNKDEVFNALARNQFSITGNNKSQWIDYVQADLLAACSSQESKALIGY